MCIHKKETYGIRNYHCHISLPERELDPKGKWKNKRSKIYLDINGNPIYDKKYYNEETGWDIRQPVIDESLIPKDNPNAKPYDRDPVTGHYLYQHLRERNKRDWKSLTRQGKWLEKEDLIKMHNDLDDCMNDFFAENGIDDRVIRRDTETVKLLKELGVRYGKIGPNASAGHKNKVLRTNARYNAYADAIEEALIKERALSAETELAEYMGRQSTRTINNLHAKKSAFRKNWHKWKRKTQSLHISIMYSVREKCLWTKRWTDTANTNP